MDVDPTQLTATVFIDIAVIVVVAQLAGRVASRFGQPAVVGEIIAGLLLGPTVLGAFPGDPSSELFSLDARPYLTALGDLGVTIFVFTVGLQLDLGLIRRVNRAAGISIASVGLPLVLGVLLAGYLHGAHDVVDGETVAFVPFALFIGVAMSITAFPVLARMLLEHNMYRTPIGALVLACAGADDVLGWALLAIALAALGAGSDPGVAGVLLETAGFAVAMIMLARPLLLRPFAQRFDRVGTLSPGMLAAVIAAILVSAWVTDAIGVSFVFGAFLLGVVFPREQAPRLVAAVEAKVGALVMVLLLPIFFVLPGLSVNLRGLESGALGDFVLILLVACAGKLLGAGGSARLLGSDWREASAIGVLMNTRGAMELVVLNVGLAAGVLDRDLYSLFVLMAIVTTMMTAPLVRRIYPADAVERDLAVAQASERRPTTMTT